MYVKKKKNELIEFTVSKLQDEIMENDVYLSVVYFSSVIINKNFIPFLFRIIIQYCFQNNYTNSDKL